MKSTSTPAPRQARSILFASSCCKKAPRQVSASAMKGRQSRGQFEDGINSDLSMCLEVLVIALTMLTSVAIGTLRCCV